MFEKAIKNFREKAEKIIQKKLSDEYERSRKTDFWAKYAIKLKKNKRG